MSFDSVTAMLLAWAVAPALVVAIAFGVGTLVATLAGRPLGMLTVPAGFAAVIVLFTFVLQFGAAADLAAIAIGVAAVTGWVVWWRGRGTAAQGDDRRLALYGLAAGLVAFTAGMLPLVANGKIGVLGYYLLSDPAWHTALVELLHQFGAQADPARDSSYTAVYDQVRQGYPLGTYAWPLIVKTFIGVDAVASWTPLIATTLAMSALAVFGAIRRMGASLPATAVASAAVAVGYLPLSYLAQGGFKEVLFAFTVLFTVAAAFAFGPEPFVRRRLMAISAVGAASMIYVMGAAAGLWIVAAGGPIAAIALVSASGRRIAVLGGGALWGAIFAVLALPAIVSAIELLDTVQAVSTSESQTGNLIGPVPKTEVFNVWLGADYRAGEPTHLRATQLAVLIAAVMTGVGLLAEILKRRLLVPVLVFACGVAALWVGRRYNIYFAAKTLVVLAPAIGLATVAGIVWLCRSERWMRVVGYGAAGLLLLVMAGSYWGVYRNVWITPQDRLAELVTLNDDITVDGPTLVNDREEYARVLMRDVAPWESFGMFQPDRGFRPGAGSPPPVTPDLDDYNDEHLRRFEALVTRRRPGASRPPAGFEKVEETVNYEYWQLQGPASNSRFPLGNGTVQGSAPLDCTSPAVRTLAREPLLIVSLSPGPVIDLPIATFNKDGAPWGPLDRGRFMATTANDQRASRSVKLERRELYDLYVQGQFGRGMVVRFNDVHNYLVPDDLGSPDQWHLVGTVEGSGVEKIELIPQDRSPLAPGAARGDLVGGVAFAPFDREHRLVRITGKQLKRYCGRDVDWVEVTR